MVNDGKRSEKVYSILTLCEQCHYIKTNEVRFVLCLSLFRIGARRVHLLKYTRNKKSNCKKLTNKTVTNEHFKGGN